MDAEKKPKPQPNTLLRRQRELRNFTLQGVADKLYEMCIKEGKDSGISADTVGRWERGITQPEAHYRAKLCALFGKSTTALGLIEQEYLVESSQTHTPPSTSLVPSPFGEERYNGTNLERGDLPAVQEVPVVLIPTHQGIDLLRDTSNATLEQKLGALLTLEAINLATFFDEGWPVDELLETLRVVLPGVQAMSKITRRTFGRKLIQLGAAAAVSGIPVPSGRHISAEDLAKLHGAIGESIATSWKLIQTSRPDQILALGHAQLSLIQQSSSYLYPNVLPLFYSGVYRLVGAALHFQGRYGEAYQAHERAYFTALEGMDVWNMTQSRQWQADVLKAQGRFDESLQTTNAALRLISTQTDLESIRTKAHLLSSSAEIAALIGDIRGVQLRLNASKELVEQFSQPHEEFDRAGWHQLAGTCALILKDYDIAVEELHRGINELPTQWTLRRATALMPLAIAYARQREKARCLEIAEKATQGMEVLSSPSLNRQFASYMRQELPQSFQNDGTIRTFLSDVEHRLMLKEPSAPHRLN